MEPSTPSPDSSHPDETNTLGIHVPDVNADLQASEDEPRQASPDKAEAQKELETAPDSPGPLSSNGSSDVLSEYSSVTESTDAAVKTPDENTDSHNSDGSEASDINTSSEGPNLRAESPDGSTVSSQSASDNTVVVPFRRASGLIKRVTRWICVALLIGLILLLSLCCVKDSHPFLNHLVFNRYAEQTCHITKIPLLCSPIVCHVNGLLHRVSTAVVGQGSESSGRQLATEFSQTYNNLSQVIAANNVLYQVPRQIRAGRMDLRRMKKRLPPASTAHEPIDQFLLLSLHRDQNLSDFTHMISRLGKSALIEHAATNETLVTVRQSPLVSNYISDSFIRATGWKNVQEKRVQRQLKSNLDTLRPGVDYAYLAASEQLQAFSELRHVAADIRLQIEKDRARFGQEKSDLMQEHHFLVRVMIKAFGSPEPREVLHLTQALIVADELVDWTTGSEGWLGKLVLYLADVKGCMDALSDAIHGQDRAIRWAADNGAKLEALDEFMMLTEEGVAPLRINARAYNQQLTMYRRG
ncbi:MAG: hypothetical protein Q9210_000983 [Variospora velana]